jgi:hypothetical protein
MQVEIESKRLCKESEEGSYRLLVYQSRRNVDRRRSCRLLVEVKERYVAGKSKISA